MTERLELHLALGVAGGWTDVAASAGWMAGRFIPAVAATEQSAHAGMEMSTSAPPLEPA